MRRVKILGIVMALMAITAAVKVAYPSATLRYKITVSIDTPEGVRTGSAVREVFIQRQPELPESGPHIVPKGEAVVVDLGKRGVVFALTSFDDYQVIFKAFPYHRGGLTVEGLKYYSQLKNVKEELKPERYPMLVTFRNLEDPKSVVALRETSGCLKRDQNGTCVQEGFHVTADRFEEMFGKGVRLGKVEIEMTDESITTGVVDWLPWIPIYHDKMLDGLKYNTISSQYPLANSLSAGAFSTEALHE